MENKDDLNEQVVETKSFEKTPLLEKKSSRVLILTMLSAVFVLSVLLVLFIAGVFSKDSLDIEGECEYMGKIYADGEQFPVGDGCNSCICNGDTGLVSCTNMPCVRDDTEEEVEEPVEEEAVELEFPSDIYEAQVYKEYRIGNKKFLVYQRPNMNVPISESNDESGVLYAKERDVKWKSFIRISELGDSKNNVFFFAYDSELNSYATLLIDANGAGSGEGIAKLVALDKEEDSWEVLNCFYYIPEDWDLNNVTNIKDEVENYIENNPQYIQDITGTSCTDFEIVL